ncbi:MAG: sigma 54-interacting transcriptional regulator [Halieaceae bacterium]|jgi:two-component system nitrogen regulation response regulator GlnG|nr:sigma 54-interacting transcriptional regulator [Halieaceae bacterium]
MRTLPSLVTVESPDRNRRALRLTIVFHPDISRIGQHSDLAEWSHTASRPPLDLSIGRSAPIFSDGEALAEPHVSREALQVRTRGDGLQLAVPDPAVKCRIGQHEVNQIRLADADLRAGIPIRLGHGVVVYLREVEVAPSRRGLPSEYFPGCSPEAERVRQLMAAAAACELPVLILGESGVGKELIASGIHEHSERRESRMVAVNMTAISESLAPAELFGTAKGAFTGALSRAGYFQQADGSTLLLDEIGDTPTQIQVQLLRALQEREVQVVGGKTVAVDIRVIAATDGSVEESAGFRNALRQRLAGLTINVPPLRERREDIGPQVLRMLEVAGVIEDLDALAGQLRQAETAAWWARVFFDFLLGDWPGNSRELKNAVLQAMVVKDEPWQYQPDVADAPVVAEVTDDDLLRVYEANGFEPKATAKALGLSHGTVYRRLEKHPDCRIAADVTLAELNAAVAAVGGRDPEALSRYLRVSERGLMQKFPQLRRGQS